MICRVLPYAEADGATNMAIDEALLASVDANPNSAVFRSYGWSEPTLSMGYFQRFEEVATSERWRSVSVVRRLTGGGAIWHDRDITYAIVIPRTHEIEQSSEALYQAVHAHVIERLRVLRVDAMQRGAGLANSPVERPFLCFEDRDPNDVVVGPHKILGSAKRRRARASLQHGSLLLHTSALTPNLTGLDCLDPWFATHLSDLRASLEGVPRSLGFQAQPGTLSDAERTASKRIRQNRYDQSDWLKRR